MYKKSIYYNYNKKRYISRDYLNFFNKNTQVNITKSFRQNFATNISKAFLL